MAEISAEIYRVAPLKSPSLWNQDTAIGALAGTFVLGPIGTVIGGVIGGFWGKRGMEEEERVGRIVRPPTTTNKRAVIGALAGGLIGSVGFAVALIAAMIVVPPLFPVVAAHTFAFSVASFVVAGAAAVVGFRKGGTTGYNRMAEEYRAAARAGAEKVPELGRAGPALPEQRIGLAHVSPRYHKSVTPEEMALLESRLKQGGESVHSAAEQEERRRAQSASSPASEASEMKR